MTELRNKYKTDQNWKIGAIVARKVTNAYIYKSKEELLYYVKCKRHH